MRIRTLNLEEVGRRGRTGSGTEIKADGSAAAAAAGRGTVRGL